MFITFLLRCSLFLITPSSCFSSATSLYHHLHFTLHHPPLSSLFPAAGKKMECSRGTNSFFPSFSNWSFDSENMNFQTLGRGRIEFLNEYKVICIQSKPYDLPLAMPASNYLAGWVPSRLPVCNCLFICYVGLLACFLSA